MAEWQTRQTQNLLSERTWEFESPRPHQLNQGLARRSALNCHTPEIARRQIGGGRFQFRPGAAVTCPVETAIWPSGRAGLALAGGDGAKLSRPLSSRIAPERSEGAVSKFDACQSSRTRA